MSAAIPGPPSPEVDAATFKARAAAEGRDPQTGELNAPPTRRLSSVRRQASDVKGTTVCSWNVSLQKESGVAKVSTDATISCTADVSSTTGSLYLFRDSTLIAHDNESGGRYLGLFAEASCALSGTRFYDAELDYGIVSDVNGSATFGPHVVGGYISC